MYSSTPCITGVDEPLLTAATYPPSLGSAPDTTISQPSTPAITTNSPVGACAENQLPENQRLTVHRRLAMIVCRLAR